MADVNTQEKEQKESTGDWYRCLDWLEKDPDYMPLRHGIEPLWRLKVVPLPLAQAQVHGPSWGWSHPRKADAPHAITVDANAAFLSAYASAPFGHDGLTRDRSGEWRKRPGIYLVDRWDWPQDAGIPSPFGTVLDDRVWVAAPTVELLLQVADHGYGPPVTIHDAYTSRYSVRFRPWATRINQDRKAVIKRGIDNPAYDTEKELDRIKQGYSAPMEMWPMPPQGKPKEGKTKKNKAYRPDWVYTVLAQYTASMWRRAFHAWRFGIHPIGMGGTDETSWDIEDWHDAQNALAKAPYKVDQTGAEFGHVKVKKVRGEVRHHTGCCLPWLPHDVEPM